ncbi:MAG: OprO/OprP family phosphate-selective porin [Acidobacteriota bacterium]
MYGRRAIAGAVALYGLVLSPAVRADDGGWSVRWDDGFRFESPDRRFALGFGGRIQADWTFTDPDGRIDAEVGPVRDGNEFRRARLFVEGRVYERVEFKAQYDFAGGDVDFKDVYIGIRDTPIGSLRFGHLKEPFSLEELTSSKYIAFLERSLPNAFAPQRNTGAMLFDHVGDRFTWAVGLFREADDAGGTADAEKKLNITGRVTGLPLYRDGGRHLLHLGLGFTRKDLGDEPFRFASRPEVHQSPEFVDTGTIPGDRFKIYGAEIAYVAHRFWLAAERMIADGDAPSKGDPRFDGTYIQAGFFLTRDHRRYATASGSFGRMRPEVNFGEEGSGAWELAVRYSSLDLSDAMVAGGELENLSFAVNWYLNPVTRLMLNYVRSDRDDPAAGESDFFLARFQIDF